MCKWKKHNLSINIPRPDELAFPCNYRIVGFIPLTMPNGSFGGRCGMAVDLQWESSTGQLGDLSRVYSNELISKPVKMEGCFQMERFQVSQYVHTSLGKSTDAHSFPPDWAFRGSGEIIIDQLFVYGASKKAAPNSGFRITKKVEEIAKGRFKVTTSKIGATVRVREYIDCSSGDVVAGPEEYVSEPGQGRACVVQILERGGERPIKADLCIR